MDSLGDIYEELGVRKESTVGEIEETFKEMDVGDRKWFSEYREILLDPIKKKFYDQIDELAQILSKAKRRKRYFESIDKCDKWSPEEVKIESELSSLISKTIRSIETHPAGRATCLLWKRFLYLLVDVGEVKGLKIDENSLRKIYICISMFTKMEPPEADSGLDIYWDNKKLALLMMLPYLKILLYAYALGIAEACNQLIEGQDVEYKVPDNVKVTADLMRRLIFCRFATCKANSYYREDTMEEIILPSMGYTNEEMRLYEKNPTEYANMRIGQVFRYNYGGIGCDHEAIFDFQFRLARTAFCWLEDTYDTDDLEQVCEFCFEILERPTEGNELDKEKALHLIRAALFIGRNKKPESYREDVKYKLFSEYLPDLIEAKSTFLRARACSMLNAFRPNCEFWEEVNERQLELYRNLANEQELCVRLEVIMLAISYFTYSSLENRSSIPRLHRKLKPLRCQCPEYILKSALERTESDRSRFWPFLEDIAPKLESLIDEMRFGELTLASIDSTE